jgi:hypothetical protein
MVAGGRKMEVAVLRTDAGRKVLGNEWRRG